MKPPSRAQHPTHYDPYHHPHSKPKNPTPPAPEHTKARNPACRAESPYQLTLWYELYTLEPDLSYLMANACSMFLSPPRVPWSQVLLKANKPPYYDTPPLISGDQFRDSRPSIAQC